MLGIDRQVLCRPPERQTLLVVLQNCEKSAVKYSIEKPMLLNFFFFVSRGILENLFCLPLIAKRCAGNTRLQLYRNHTSAWVFSPVDLLHIFRTCFLQNTSEGLILLISGICPQYFAQGYCSACISFVYSYILLWHRLKPCCCANSKWRKSGIHIVPFIP